MKPLAYDPRKMDADGLPHLGRGEQFYHASFEVIGEDKYVEGVVAAKNGQEAASFLLQAEAWFRGRPYPDMIHLAQHALTGKLTRTQALELAPKVTHRVSMWKQSQGADLPAVGDTAELALS